MTSEPGPIASQRARNAQLRAQAEAIAGSDARVHPLVMVPANSRPLAPLPQESRRAFTDRLAMLAGTAVAQPGRVDGDDSHAGREDPDREPPPSAWDAMLAQACGVCGGSCCTAGGIHAFLRVETILRVQRQHPAWDADTIVDAYVRHLPDHHFAGSCVFHGVAGCTLPRTMRAALCNRYSCGGLTQLSRTLSAAAGRASPPASDTTGPVAVVIGAADAQRLHRVARIDGMSVIPLATDAAGSVPPAAP